MQLEATAPGDARAGHPDRDDDAGRAAAPVPDTGATAVSPVAPILAWCALVGLGAWLVQTELVSPGISRFTAPPLHATLDRRIEPWIALALVVAAGTAACGARVAARLRWRALLAATWALSIAWAVSLSGVRGWGRVTTQLQRPSEYLPAVGGIDSIGEFLRGFVGDIEGFPVHVQGHPPGFVVLLWALRAVGLGGPVAASWLCIVAGALAAPAALVVVREVVDVHTARRAAPFVVLAPAAIFVATSADAFFAGVGGCAVALVAIATTRTGRAADAAALAGGLLFGITVFLSYGLVLLAAVPLVVAIRRRTPRPVVLAIVGAIPVFLAFLAAGFWWLDGLFATHDRYVAGVASRRPYEIFMVANLSSFAIVVGPAIAVALRRLRDPRLWLVVGGGLLAVALADLSGMSKSEVERIWLPFTPYVLVAGAVLLVPRPSTPRGVVPLGAGAGWLATQAGVAIALEGLVRTGW